MESEHKFMLNDILRKKRKSKMRKPECLVFLLTDRFTFPPWDG